MSSENSEPKVPAEKNAQNPPTGHQPPNNQGQAASVLAEVPPQNRRPHSEVAIQNGDSISPEELAQIWARRAYDLAEEPPAEETGQTVDLQVFRLAGESYGLEVTGVREIHPLHQLTPVPRTPPFVAGVFSARGRLLSIIDLRAFMGLPAIERSDQTRIIVVTNTDPTSETAGMEIGILADEVDDVVTIFKEDIEPPLTTHSSAESDYIEGVATGMLVALNLSTLLSDKRLIVKEELI